MVMEQKIVASALQHHSDYVDLKREYHPGDFLDPGGNGSRGCKGTHGLNNFKSEKSLILFQIQSRKRGNQVHISSSLTGI